jgi:hypothetical protein
LIVGLALNGIQFPELVLVLLTRIIMLAEGHPPMLAVTTALLV